MRLGLITTAAVLLASCGKPQDATDMQPSPTAIGASPSPASSISAKSDSGSDSTERWSLQPTGQGAVLALLGTNRSAVVQLICFGGEDRLLVNVPGFLPIDSEERLSFGSDGNAAVLVADPGGDTQHGGITGAGTVPEDLAALVANRLSASYGAQSSGPHPAPPPALSRAFVAACGRKPLASAQPSPQAHGAVSACSVQDGKSIRVTPRSAVGTEPFWAARIEGRCIVYSHPEDQDGTRVWTRYAKNLKRETWAGALEGQPFELRAWPDQSCSDGMSDKRYPLAVELKVRGELRRGCAKAL
ncbi:MULTISPECIES: hypothetical protein [Sphingomonas]|jgi:uncharacterized membrane protein|uniref:hypothetical protein n=1 Tax=Sphingomonas TaxID=13687 RepID=UPI0010425765|nr:hypothetical protein [Sphingomonas turrisvirgatae]